MATRSQPHSALSTASLNSLNSCNLTDDTARDGIMQQIIWDAVAIFCVWTLIGSLVMKYLFRQVPIRSHAAILFWAMLRVQIVVLALIVLGSVFSISVRSLSSLFGGLTQSLFPILALCAVGWLVTRDLSKKYGVPTKFPAVGAKVMTTMYIITLLIVVAIIVMTGA